MAPYRRMVAKNILDGFILDARTFDDPRIAWLSAQGVPFVVHGREAEAPQPYPFYDIDNARLTRDSAALLMDLGRRRIAFLNRPRRICAYARTRRAAFAEALAARGLATPPRFLLPSAA